jgi:hypothetical protein
MWGFAHLDDRRGAISVTITPQKGQSAISAHNLARGFEKASRRCASVGAEGPRDDTFAVI